MAEPSIYKMGAAVGIRFIYKLKDQFIGQYFTMFASHTDTNAMELTTRPGEVPEGTRYLSAAMESGLKPGGVVNGYVAKCVSTKGSTYAQFQPLLNAEFQIYIHQEDYEHNAAGCWHISNSINIYLY